MAKKYYDKLYKEFALVDLSRYQTGQYEEFTFLFLFKFLF